MYLHKALTFAQQRPNTEVSLNTAKEKSNKFTKERKNGPWAPKMLVVELRYPSLHWCIIMLMNQTIHLTVGHRIGNQIMPNIIKQMRHLLITPDVVV